MIPYLGAVRHSAGNFGPHSSGNRRACRTRTLVMSERIMEETRRYPLLERISVSLLALESALPEQNADGLPTTSLIPDSQIVRAGRYTHQLRDTCSTATEASVSKCLHPPLLRKAQGASRWRPDVAPLPDSPVWTVRRFVHVPSGDERRWCKAWRPFLRMRSCKSLTSA